MWELKTQNKKSWRTFLLEISDRKLRIFRRVTAWLWCEVQTKWNWLIDKIINSLDNLLNQWLCSEVMPQIRMLNANQVEYFPGSVLKNGLGSLKMKDNIRDIMRQLYVQRILSNFECSENNKKNQCDRKKWIKRRIVNCEIE